MNDVPLTRKFTNVLYVPTALTSSVLNSQVSSATTSGSAMLVAAATMLAAQARASIVAQPSQAPLFVRKQAVDASSNTGIADIATTEVCFKRGSSPVDGFFVKITVSIDAQKATNVKALRLFRAQSETASLKRNFSELTFHGLSRLATQSGRKNKEFISMNEKHLIENDVSSSLTSLLKVDPFTGLRTSFDARGASGSAVPQLLHVGARRDTTRDALVSSFVLPGHAAKIDRAVASNLNLMKNVLSQDPSLRVTVLNSVKDVRVLDSVTIDRPVTTVEQNNAPQFREIATFSISPGQQSIVALDNHVLFGNSYTYYVSVIDSSMNESGRSQLITVSIERITPPAPPQFAATTSDRWVTLSCLSDDPFVERFEIFRRENALSSVSDNSIQVSTVDVRGVSTSQAGVVTESGLIQIGETFSSPGTSCPFNDETVVPGRSYTYRAYSIDSFGNKSQVYSEATAFVSDRSDRQNDLKKPTIIAELDSTTGYVKLKMTNDDDRVQSLVLRRRDLTLHERAFHDPSFSALAVLGNAEVTRTRSLTDVVLSDKQSTWQSLFMLQQGKDVIETLDSLARYDRTYQYSVIGRDRFGNTTPQVLSSPIFVSRDPRVATPVNVSASFETSGSLSVVRLSWTDANLNISPLDLIGDRTTLQNNSVKALFQVERKAVFEENWQPFPMIDSTSLIDQVSDDEAPRFRPDYLRHGSVYQYRVAAFQSGSFISDFSFPVAVKTYAPVSPPVGLVIRTAEQTYRPFYVVLNWSKDPASGAVDSWEIERAVVNNFAAASIDARNQDALKALSFSPLALVGQEASRARPVSIDATTVDDKNRTFFGERIYIDGDVQFGNTCYYRVRAVAPDGGVSSWELRAVRVTSQAFEKQLLSSMSAAEIAALSANVVPLRSRR